MLLRMWRFCRIAVGAVLSYSSRSGFVELKLFEWADSEVPIGSLPAMLSKRVETGVHHFDLSEPGSIRRLVECFRGHLGKFGYAGDN